jgi:ubiquinone/menaquinone biosynthesis C-methylase UbiE
LQSTQKEEQNKQMHLPITFKLILFLQVTVLFCSPTLWSEDVKKSNSKDSYYLKGERTKDGIGKYYLGREISQVMGHLGAGWLERPKREQEERTDLLIKNMKLSATDHVADIGAGSGYFSFRISPLVPQGRVHAVDISPQMLGIIRAKKGKGGFDNILTVQSSIKNTTLEPNSIDCALIVDAYHEFSYPREMAQSIFRSLKQKGRLILIEYRQEDPGVPIKLLHKMSEKQARKEICEVGYVWKETLDFLPQQHFIVFEKPSAEK